MHSNIVIATVIFKVAGGKQLYFVLRDISIGASSSSSTQLSLLIGQGNWAPTPHLPINAIPEAECATFCVSVSSEDKRNNFLQ